MTLLMLEFLIHYRFIVGETRAVLSYGRRETAIPTVQWENRGRKHNAQNVFHLHRSLWSGSFRFVSCASVKVILIYLFI